MFFMRGRKNMDINIILFNDFETLDIFGPIEVLASIETHKLHYYSVKGGVIVSSQGTRIITENLRNANKKGIMVIPGGRGTRKLVEDIEFLDTIRTYIEEAQYCLSICTGSALLAKTHLLDGSRATSNKKAFSWVESTSNKVTWIRKARWVVDGKFYTSSGVSAGIDMTLGFISDIYGIDKAEQIAEDIEYLWNKNMQEDLFSK